MSISQYLEKVKEIRIKHYPYLEMSLLIVLALLLALPIYNTLNNKKNTNNLSSKASSLTTTVPGMTVKDTNYPVPTNALFVSFSGNDSNSGTDMYTPLKTIKAAISKASTGGTIVIRSGTYREDTLNFGSKSLTLQPYPHEEVWIKGSLDVTNWTQNSNYWQVDWPYTFTHDADSNAITSANPFAGNPETVYFDGQFLSQVGSISALTPGTYYFDQSSTVHKMYIGSDPTGHIVEISAYKMGISLAGNSGSIIRGLGFAHYAPGYGSSEGGMVRIDGSNTQNILLENNTFAYSGGRGLVVYEIQATLRGNTFAYNGNAGGDASGSGTNMIQNMLAENNSFSFNNKKHFAPGWDAAGFKLSRASNAIFRDNVFEGNESKGLWFDGYCDGATIVRNLIKNNTDSGLKYEISSNAVIASNVVVGNKSHGVNIGAGAQYVKAFNNTVSKNKDNFSIVDSADDPRTTHDISLVNNILSDAASGSFLTQVIDYSSPALAPSTLLNVSNFNDYYRSSVTSPSTLISWGGTNYTSLATFSSSTSRDTNSFETSGGTTNPFFKDELNGDYNLTSTAHPLGSGQPLTDQSIVNAINSGLLTAIVSLNTTINRGAISWPSTTTIISPTPTTATSITSTPTAVLPTSTIAPINISPTTSSSIIKIPDISDSFVKSAYTTQNSGTSNKLYVDYNPYQIAYIKFDLSSLAGKTVKTANLKIKSGNSSSDSSKYTQNIKLVTDKAWSESTINYNNRPASSTLLGSISTGSSYNSWQTLDLTNIVNQSIANGEISISIDESKHDTAAWFSKESGVDSAPYIEVTLN